MQAVMAGEASRGIGCIGMAEGRRLEGRGIMAGIAIVVGGQVVGRLAERLGAIMTGEAVVREGGMVGLRLPGGEAGMAGFAIGARRNVGWRLAGVLHAVVAGEAVGRRIGGGVIEQGRLEGDRCVARFAIIARCNVTYVLAEDRTSGGRMCAVMAGKATRRHAGVVELGWGEGCRVVAVFTAVAGGKVGAALANDRPGGN